jgi:cytochrome P450
MEFGAKFPAWMGTEWLNLDTSPTPTLAATAAKWIKAWRERDGEKTTANSMKMYDMAKGLLAQRRENPRCPKDDPASSLLLEKDTDGNPLDEVHLM